MKYLFLLLYSSSLFALDYCGADLRFYSLVEISKDNLEVEQRLIEIPKVFNKDTAALTDIAVKGKKEYSGVKILGEVIPLKSSTLGSYSENFNFYRFLVNRGVRGKFVIEFVGPHKNSCYREYEVLRAN